MMSQDMEWVTSDVECVDVCFRSVARYEIMEEVFVSQVCLE